jgi:hypothetical protein
LFTHPPKNLPKQSGYEVEDQLSQSSQAVPGR